MALGPQGNHFRIAHFDPDVSLEALISCTRPKCRSPGRACCVVLCPARGAGAYEGRGFCSALWARQGRGPRGNPREDSGSRIEHRGYGAKRPGVVIDFIHRHPALSRLFLEAVKAAQSNRKRLGSAT